MNKKKYKNYSLLLLLANKWKNRNLYKTADVHNVSCEPVCFKSGTVLEDHSTWKGGKQ